MLRERLYLECSRGFNEEAEWLWVDKAESLGLGREEIAFMRSYRLQLENLRIVYAQDQERLVEEAGHLSAKLKRLVLKEGGQ